MALADQDVGKSRPREMESASQYQLTCNCFPKLHSARTSPQHSHMVDKHVPEDLTMAVNERTPLLADTVASTSHVFLDNNASMKKSKRKRTRYSPTFYRKLQSVH